MSRVSAVATQCAAAVLAARAASLPAQVPADLRPLLTPLASEMRLVVRRYELDRQRLDDNYAGARPDARGRHGGVPRSSPPRAPVSEARLARLRQFDLSWQRALAALDAAGLSDAGRADVSTLTAAIAANLAALDDARHDEILRQGSMPIALLRLAVSDMPLRRDLSLDWRFY